MSRSPERERPGRPLVRRRNPVQRAKIVGSKWTARRPENREKHFIVVGWVVDEQGEATEYVELEAVLTERVRRLHWRELADVDHWVIGWT